MKFLENIEETIKGLEQTLFSLHPECENIYNGIQTLKSLKNEVDKNPFGAPFPVVYNTKETVANKILFALHNLNRFAKAADILDKIKEHEPGFNMGLSTPLTNLRIGNAIVIMKPSGSNKYTYYGFPMWVNDLGNPKLEYISDKDARDIIRTENLINSINNDKNK
jgi:hypothetical protein